MNIRIGVSLLVACVVAAACGSDDETTNGGGGGADCASATQQFPAPICDATTRNCQGTMVLADADACNQCVQTAQRIQGGVTALTACTCENCAGPLGACFESGDATRDAMCRAIVECGQTTGCRGTDCYCGIGVPVTDCLANGPMGPCMAQIDAAAAASDNCMAGDAICVATAQVNPMSAVGRAYAVGACATGDPTAMVTGACEGVPNQ